MSDERITVSELLRRWADAAAGEDREPREILVNFYMPDFDLADWPIGPDAEWPVDWT